MGWFISLCLSDTLVRKGKEGVEGECMALCMISYRSLSRCPDPGERDVYSDRDGVLLSLAPLKYDHHTGFRTSNTKASLVHIP